VILTRPVDTLPWHLPCRWGSLKQGLYRINIVMVLGPPGAASVAFTPITPCDAAGIESVSIC
jgi:hypothetical protein